MSSNDFESISATHLPSSLPLSFSLPSFASDSDQLLDPNSYTSCNELIIYNNLSCPLDVSSFVSGVVSSSYLLPSLPLFFDQSSLVSNTYSMLTRSKASIFKPKMLLASVENCGVLTILKTFSKVSK